MREEVYRDYVKRAKRRAANLEKQKQQQLQQQRIQDGNVLEASSTATKNRQDDTSSWSAYLPGWLVSIGAEDEPERKEEGGLSVEQNTIKPEQTIDRESQLWELATHEGDDNFRDWVENHIWTYIGLSAPMLGAVNPLRAVISGENMGLPIADEIAREMELSKSIAR
jgi:hypothetical protein